MAFTRNIPAASDFLSDSQADIRDNFNSSDDVFTIEHYAFSNTTANKGFHNRITQPQIIGGVHPTTSTNPVIYAMQDCAGIGVIQYSKGPNFNGISPTPLTYAPSPTPLTNVYSNGAAPIVLTVNQTVNMLDFTGLTSAIGTIWVTNLSDLGGTFFVTVDFVWNASVPIFKFNSRRFGGLPGSAASLEFLQNVNILQLKNVSAGTISNLYWTINFQRLNVT